MSMFLRCQLMALGLMASLLSFGVHANHAFMQLSAQEREWIAANPVLRVGVFDTLIPFEYLSGNQLRGLSSKYLKRISRYTGLRFEYVKTTTRSARKDMLIGGEVDILSTRRRSENGDDDGGMLYTRPYNTSSTILVSRVGPQPVTALEQMADMTLVMLGREAYGDFLRAQAPGVTVIAADNAVDMLAVVKGGRADAAIASEWLLAPYLSRQFQGVLQISGVVPQLDIGISMAVREDDTILLSILDKLLSSVSVDERKSIYDEWLADMNLDIPTLSAIAEHYDSELWLLLIVVVLLLALFFQRHFQRRRAVQNEQDMAMFLAVTSHEIRSPMNALLAAVELLEHTSLDEQQRHLTDLASSSATRLLHLVDDVLDISRMDAGQLTLNLEPVDLPALIQRETAAFRVQAEEKGLVSLYRGEVVQHLFMLDESRLAQIMRNLIANAIKFTDSGRVEIQLQMFQGPTAGTRRVSLRVVDSGIGLSAQVLQSLFRPYARARSTYRRPGGTGLGLVISRRLVKLMHGRLRLSSAQGVGTTVEIVLPIELAHVPDALGGQETSVTEADTPQVSTLRILVVEGAQASRKALRAQLEGQGCEVLLANDAEQGLALFSRQQVDLVLMDCDLPEHGGYDLACDLRDLEREQQRRYCPIIAISVLVDSEHQERCFDAGMDGVLGKPVHPGKLQEVIELWCNVSLAPQVQPQRLERPAVHDEVRTTLGHLLEATALGDTDAAMHALSRLHSAALILDWADMAAAAAGLERLLRVSGEGQEGGATALLRELVEYWRALAETPA